MMKRPHLRFVLTFIFFALSATLLADYNENDLTHGAVKLEKPFLYLFDRAHHDRHAIKITDDKLLPRRVYLKYDEEFHAWVYIKTESNANFPKPMEALRPDSVAPGSVIGAQYALQRFILKDNGIWVPTTETEKYKIFVKTNPPQLKILTYAKPAPKKAPQTSNTLDQKSGPARANPK